MNKVDLWIFQDVSGSCLDITDKDRHIINNLNLEKFNVKMFCFDVVVYETVYNKIIGRGGTDFNCIEKYIQNKIKEHNLNYPNVLIISDGLGDLDKPKHPEKWNWYLQGESAGFIPKFGNIYRLCDLESVINSL
jgi:hypothetical protein